MITDVYIKNTKIDLYGDVDIRLTYQINDLRDIESVQTDFSYTITVPGSKTNNELFGHIYELQNDNIIYNPNFKEDVQVYADGNQVFNGFVQLSKITKDSEDKIEYEIILYGSLGNFFADIADNDLSDINLSEFNHTYSRTNIANSWNTSILRNNVSESFKFGTGYVYPLVERGINTSPIVRVEEMFPSVYAKELLDRIFNEAGYTYNSKFLTSDYFKKLIIPFNKDGIPLTQYQIDTRSCHATITSTSALNRTATVAGTFYMTPLFNTEVSDPAGTFNSSYTFSAPKKGRYRIEYSLYGAEYFDSLGVLPFSVVGNNITYEIQLIKNGAIIYTLPGTFVHTAGPHFSNPEFTDYQTFTYDVNALPGDYYYLRVGYTIPSSSSSSKFINNLGQAIPGNIQFRMKSPSFVKVTAYNDGIVEGDPMPMNYILPENVKKRDYVKSIFRMFNLLVLPNKNDGSNLIIEPRDDFYRASGEFNDWTKKMKRETIELAPLSELLDKTFEYSYKEDSDYYNATYQKNYDQVFGELKYDVNNDFVEGTNTLDVIFSPTINAADPNGLSAPHFLTYDNSGLPKPAKTNIRILFYSGLKQGTLTIPSITAPTNVTYTSYPYCGMQNDPISPTEDLAFGTPLKIYYALQTGWTDSNLFNKFHQNTLAEISDKNSKLLTAYFDLSPVDIAEFDFRDKILIDNVYWRVNKIDGYSPVDNQLTKVELFSPIDPYLFVPKSKTVFTGPLTGATGPLEFYDTIISDGPIVDPTLPSGSFNRNSVQSAGNTTVGSDNIVGTTSLVSVNGSFNNIGTGVLSSSVIGTGNTVSSNIKNVVVIGSNDKNVITSDTIVLGDSFVIKQGSGLLPVIDLIDGGINLVQNPFNAVVPIDITDSGLNSPRPFGSDSVIMIVDSGQDIVNPNSQI